MKRIKIPNLWQPRSYQMDLWRYLENGGKRAVAVWHRRAGKDSLALNWTAVAAMQRKGVYWHMLPLQTQARKVVWDAIDKRGRRVIDQVFPPALRKSVNSQEMKIELLNGSIWQCVGSDHYNALVGANPRRRRIFRIFDRRSRGVGLHPPDFGGKRRMGFVHLYAART